MWVNPEAEAEPEPAAAAAAAAAAEFELVLSSEEGEDDHFPSPESQAEPGAEAGSEDLRSKLSKGEPKAKRELLFESEEFEDLKSEAGSEDLRCEESEDLKSEAGWSAGQHPHTYPLRPGLILASAYS